MLTLRIFSHFKACSKQCDHLNNMILYLLKNACDEKCTLINWTFLGNIDTLLIEASKRKYRWEVAFFNQDWHLCSETVTERVNTHDDIR